MYEAKTKQLNTGTPLHCIILSIHQVSVSNRNHLEMEVSRYIITRIKVISGKTNKLEDHTRRSKCSNRMSTKGLSSGGELWR